VARKPTRASLGTLAQLCNLIPPFLVSKVARQCGVDKKARTFSCWSHVVALLFAQLTHALSLNDVCDALKNHGGKLSRIRRATAPSRNTLSHANRQRDGRMAQALFWEILDHLTTLCPRFGGQTFKGMPRRFRRTVYAVDSTTIQLVTNCIDWARHRRRKAAAKLHLRLNLQCFLPTFAIVDTAAHNDNRRARELCAGLEAGEIAVFDKAYMDFSHLFELARRGVFWVTRAKDNLTYRVRKRLVKKPTGKILRDELIFLTGVKTREKYPEVLRVVRALVEIDGQEREMEFLTNNLEWAASSIADLYKSRWQIEVFFREIKQTLQLCDFLGHNKNAVVWQVWIALLLYVLLRFLAFANSWRHGFKRFFCLLRSCVWDNILISDLASRCGTAGGLPAIRAAVEQLYLPGFGPPTHQGV
jgi:uncharacterized membrane protein